MGDFILETVEKEHNRMALNVAALAGDILLASGAEIFRVEETINRIAHAYGIDSRLTATRIKTLPGYATSR